jgi:hypothetical protein
VSPCSLQLQRISDNQVVLASVFNQAVIDAIFVPIFLLQILFQRLSERMILLHSKRNFTIFEQQLWASVVAFCVLAHLMASMGCLYVRADTFNHSLQELVSLFRVLLVHPAQLELRTFVTRCTMALLVALYDAR